MVHMLKTLPKYFDAAEKGEKPFEVRKDDRNFKVGDTLILEKYENGEYLNKIHKVNITYILGREEDEKQYVPEGYVILGTKH
ncbi:DUF3850 domain-containing protein [Clostridium sp. YIM B02551]|uniref:DUF3850 domain-containing protein n=1 Tax=Clostridium sp. YIM B02551 TaxID=2910679 RepID=UPI001EEA879B|nr:DUF3850 domain-containing protein [Clostridium sp. YIM B02551]